MAQCLEGFLPAAKLVCMAESGLAQSPSWSVTSGEAKSTRPLYTLQSSKYTWLILGNQWWVQQSRVTPDECEYLWLWDCSSFRVAGISSSSSSCSWLRGCPVACTTVNKTSWMLSCHALYSNRKWRTLPSYITSSPSANNASSSYKKQSSQRISCSWNGVVCHNETTFWNILIPCQSIHH